MQALFNSITLSATILGSGMLDKEERASPTNTLAESSPRATMFNLHRVTAVGLLSIPNSVLPAKSDISLEVLFPKHKLHRFYKECSRTARRVKNTNMSLVFTQA